jgi:uncharacterized membrane protein YbhN (UPF0104 family)
VQWILVGVVTLFLVLAIRSAIDALQASPAALSWRQVRLPWLAMGLACSIAALFPSCIGWMQTLRDFRQTVAWRQGLYAYFLGHMGKYVPGKAMAVLLRVGYLHRHGVLVRPSIVSVFIETLTGLAVGSILGAILVQGMDSPPAWLRWSGLAGIPIALAALVPNTFRWIVAWISRSRIGTMPSFVAQAIRWRLMLRSCAWSLLGWFLSGTASWLLLMAIDPDPALLSWRAWTVCVTSVCLGSLAGFLSMLPGGAGVRELVVMWVMTTIVSQPVALASAVITRLAVIVSELVVLGVAGIMVKSEPGATNRT